MIERVKNLINQSKGQCHCPKNKDSKNIENLPKIVLVGSPNVGKSVIFNRLTGTYVSVSNYPGTTVAIDRGRCRIKEKNFGIMDLPGMYSLAPITEEERIAKLILLEEKPHIVVHVVDAKNMERMLPLTLQLIEAELPLILVVNMMDEARKLGVNIDFAQLKDKLGVPVVPIVATTGEGIDTLINEIDRYARGGKKVQIHYPEGIESSVKRIHSLLKGEYPISRRSVSMLLLQEDKDMHQLLRKKEGEAYQDINQITKEAAHLSSHPLSYTIKRRLQNKASEIVSSSLRTTSPGKLSFGEKLSRIMITPLTGIPILIAVLYFCLYQFVGVFGAQTLVDFLEVRIFEQSVNPYLNRLVEAYIPYPFLQELIAREYGIITLGVRYAVAIIFPIVGTFFLMFSVIEDTGYLPRLALLIDRVFKKIGLSGRAVIPMVLGLGCDTMATMVTRTQETRRERIISTLLLALAIPCSAQLGVIFAILSGRPQALFVWFVAIVSSFVLIGFIASRIMPGQKPSFFMELPPLRFPKFSNILTKTYTRMVWYFKEVFPLFVLASVLIWVGKVTGLFGLAVDILRYPVSWNGLPEKATIAFLFGFFRRDYGAAGLYEMKEAFTAVQLTVAAVTLTLFVPCIAQFMMMIKERGARIAILVFVFNIFFAFSVGFILNKILTTLGVIL